VTVLKDEIRAMVTQIGNEKLRGMVWDMLTNPEIAGMDERLHLEECPAGSFQHHSYRGGLIQHTVAVTRVALTLCDLIEGLYGGTVDRDLVIAGCLLHDVMKCYSYTWDPQGEGFLTSELGERIDHLTLLVAEMYRRGFPLEMIHVAASHHGEVSPVKPKTIEALIVSVADLTDSELSRRMLRAAEYLLKKTTGERPRFNSSQEVLEVVQTKIDKGWDGLRELAQEET
jgi:7,8-dihydroneopterin 2',3'-cyclic phosphate phosphodiesterase